MSPARYLKYANLPAALSMTCCRLPRTRLVPVFLFFVATTQLACADIILNLDVEPVHRQRGLERSVLMGGNVAGVQYMRTAPALSSAAMFNRNGRGFALSAGHVGVFSSFTFFTGSDASNNRGLEYQPVNVEVYPGYTLGMQLGSTADVALFTFDSLIDGAPDLIFPDAPLGQGQELIHGGLGELGIWAQAALGRDGIARAGTATTLNSTLLSGANSDTYFTANLLLNDPQSSKGANGSSGNPGQVKIGDTIYTFGIVTQGSSSIGGTTTQFVRTDLGNTAFHTWFNERISVATTAVPEPGSTALMFTSLGLYALCWRIIKR